VNIMMRTNLDDATPFNGRQLAFEIAAGITTGVRVISDSIRRMLLFVTRRMLGSTNAEERYPRSANR
jgi:hypothetical protein